MRNLLFLLTLLLFISSCGINSKIVLSEREEETPEYEIKIAESFIDCPNNSTFMMIDHANTRMGAIVDSLTIQLKDDATNFFSRVSEAKRPDWKYTLTITDTVYCVTSKIVSAKITAYTFSGGTHGVTKFFAVNYAPMEGRFLGKADILDMTKREKIDKALERHFDDEDCFTERPTADLATIVNVTKNSVIFTYEHYLLGPRSCGAAVVEVPRSEIADCLNW